MRKQVYSGTPGNWNTVPDETRVFVYDGWNLIKEIATTGETYYVWGLDLSQSMQGAGGIGGLVCRVSGTAVRHYTYDANGNVGQLVDEAGAIVARYEYDPFGNEIRAEGDDAQNNPFRFSTKYLDAETGLYYYGFRYYLVELGRWINRDPIGERGGINLYEFIFNNILNRIDVLGLDAATAGYDPNDGKHAKGKCSETNMSCMQNVARLREELAVLRYRLAVDFTYTYMYKAIFGIKHPSPNYETYTDSWSGHLIQYEQRLKVAGDCIVIIKRQNDEGKCNCNRHFFKSKQWIWAQKEYERLGKKTPPVIKRIQMPEFNPDWEAIEMMGKAGAAALGGAIFGILGALGLAGA